MRTWIRAAAGLLILGGWAAGVPGGEGRPLSEAEADRAVDAVFESATRINRLEAKLTTRKVGGAFGEEPKISYGFLRLSVPNLMWLQDYGADEHDRPRKDDPGLQQSSLTIVDGQFIWDIQAPTDPGRPSTADKMQLADSVVDAHAAHIAGLLAVFMGLGDEVRSAAELRRNFTLRAVEEPIPDPRDGRPPATNHFTLEPVDSDGDGNIIEIWHRPGDALPWKVQTSEKKVVRAFGRRNANVPQRTVLETTTRVLSEPRTNLDSLQPFPAGTFTVPKTIRIQEN